MDYAKELSRAALDIGANKIDPKNPFQWASGYRMPLYNDNRLLLGSYEHRKLAAEGFKQIIEKKGIEYDMIAGTSTAGIAPAASLASLLQCPVTILDKGNVVCLDQPTIESLASISKMFKQDYDIIASTSPYAIIPGIMIANELELPFIYVRQKKKGHGMKKQIEGISPRGNEVFLVDYHLGNSYIDEAGKVIHQERGIVKGYVSENISYLIKQIDAVGKRIVQVEDVVSTGGSCVKEIDEYRNAGTIIKHCLALYLYKFKEAISLFKESGISLDSVYSYDSLIKIAKEKELITKDDEILLDDWVKDPFGWGDKYGFHRVVKK